MAVRTPSQGWHRVPAPQDVPLAHSQEDKQQEQPQPQPHQQVAPPMGQAQP